MNNACANCHYTFSDTGECKCRLNRSADNPGVKAFSKKQQIIGYRVCMSEFNPEGFAMSDLEILEKIKANTAMPLLGVSRCTA
jgi:hypothetical protein